MSEFKLPHHSDFLKLNPGAQAVLAIRRKHEALNGAPGEKVEDLKKLDNGAAYMQKYQDGAIIWHRGTASWVHGDIYKKYGALGGPTGLLGIALTDEIPTAGGAGRYTEFQRGAIYWSPTTGANGVWGDIRSRWNQLGKERSYLGLPLTDERPWKDPENNKAGRISHFQRGAIAWTADNRKTVEFPTRRVIRSGHLGVSSVGGWVELVLTSAGSFHYKGHLHNSGFVGLHCTVGTALRIPGTKKALVARKEANVGGTISLDGRDEDWNQAGYNEEIRSNWDALMGEVEMKSTIKATLGGWEVVTLVLLPAVGAVAFIALLSGGSHPDVTCTYTADSHMVLDGNNRTVVEPNGVRCIPP